MLQPPYLKKMSLVLESHRFDIINQINTQCRLVIRTMKVFYIKSLGPRLTIHKKTASLSVLYL